MRPAAPFTPRPLRHYGSNAGPRRCLDLRCIEVDLSVGANWVATAIGKSGAFFSISFRVVESAGGVVCCFALPAKCDLVGRVLGNPDTALCDGEVVWDLLDREEAP